MNNPVVYDYKGSQISFMSGNNVMINATQMAKPFGKRPIDWLQNQSSIEYLNELSKVRKSTLADLVQVMKGGNNPGTWMHEDVALEFARWLSPSFAIWCNDRIKELLQYGITATQSTLEQIINNPNLVIKLATQLKQERAEKEQLEQQARIQNEQLKIAAPKVQYVDTVLQSVNTYTTTQIAKELCMDAVKLHKQLTEKKVMFKQSDMWMLTAKYQNKGYTKTRTQQFTRNDGSIGTNTYTVWTERGRAFLHTLLNDKLKK